MIVWEPRDAIARWVFAQIDDASVSETFLARKEDYITLGFANNESKIAGAIVYMDWCVPSVQVAASGLSGWLTPARVRAMFHFPFVAMPANGYDIQVIVSHVAEPNERAHRFNKRLGFREVGRIPRAANGKDSIIYAMTRDECRWIKEAENG